MNRTGPQSLARSLSLSLRVRVCVCVCVLIALFNDENAYGLQLCVLYVQIATMATIGTLHRHLPGHSVWTVHILCVYCTIERFSAPRLGTFTHTQTAANVHATDRGEPYYSPRWLLLLPLLWGGRSVCENSFVVLFVFFTIWLLRSYWFITHSFTFL